MANDDKTRGLLPAYHLNGGEIRPVKMIKDSTRSCGKGDLMAIATDGKLDRYLIGGVPIGVAMEASATNVAATILVVIDPDVVFRTQADASVAQSEVGTYHKVTTTAYDATLGLSKYELTASAGSILAAGASWPLQIIKKADTFNVDGTANAWGSFVKLDVLINRHNLGKRAIGI